MQQRNTFITSYKRKIRNIQKTAISKGLDLDFLKQYAINEKRKETYTIYRRRRVISVVLIVFALVLISVNVINNVLSARCLLDSNYLIWEATRPLADCSYCEDVAKPIILRNVTRQDFSRYAYSSLPIIVKNAVSHWRATKKFSFNMFKKLYDQTEGSYDTFDEGCQFLKFKTDLHSLKEVFSMSDARARNVPGEKPWYVGWANCHPDILAEVRKYYSIPDFLPEDAEYPATENIFMGYEIGAVMHLDYIPRLMWQGQLKGNKTWLVAPVPECEPVCHKLQFYVEPGDIVLLDTRIWYHATSIPKGQLSITVQSEYG